MASATIGERLAAARRRRFVGRDRELALLRELLDDGDGRGAVLFVHGPGGVGKTALLGAFADVARDAGRTVARIDARTVDASPQAFAAAIATAFGAADGASGDVASGHVASGDVASGDVAVVDVLRQVGPATLLVDTYEAAAGLDDWFRDELLPGLPADVLVVIAGRHRPAPAWLGDPGWSAVLEVVPLRNLEADAAHRYLRLAGVPDDAHDAVVRLTHGHPLALSLLVDVVVQQRRDERWTPPQDLEGVPDVVGVLLERFVERVPSDLHRRALAVCAHSRFTTEELLAHVLDDSDPPADVASLFTWLRNLSFIEEGAHGLFPHDVARDVLDADLRWRHPARYAELHRRVRAHFLERAQRSGPADRHRACTDILFLHRTNPRIRPFLDWDGFGRCYIDALRPDDHDALVEMAARHEGDESAALVAHWLARQPGSFRVFRDGGPDPIGFTALLALHDADPDDVRADPGTAAMWDHVLRHAPPAPGEEVVGMRFFVDRDAHQAPSPSFNLMNACGIEHVVTARRLAWSFAGCFVDADAVAPMFADIDYHRADDFEVGGRRYGFFAHDFRVVPVDAWIDMTGEREIEVDAVPPPPGPRLVPLQEPEFRAAVRDALRDLHRPDRLAVNPLARSRVVTGARSGDDVAAAIAAAIAEAAASLRGHPRDEKLHRALDRTYLRPAETQERAAELLDLPFSTYRRHLTRAVERVGDRLWARERGIGASGVADD